MPRRRTAFIAAAVCASAFIAVMAWDLVIEQPRLAGSQICAQDAGSAQAFGADGPGVYKFDRKTGRPVRIPASMAFAMVLQGDVDYQGEAKCGVKALTQTPGGLIAVGSLLGAIVALLIGVFTRARS